MITSSQFYKDLKDIDNARLLAVNNLNQKGLSLSSDLSIPQIATAITDIPSQTIINGNIVIYAAEFANVTLSLYLNDTLVESKTTPAVAGGYVTFNVENTGTYTLKATQDSTELWTNTITITSPGVYNCKSSKALEDYTWADIIIAAQNHFAQYMFNLWDTKKLTSFMGQISPTYTNCHIIGFEQDDKVTGGKAGITFMIRQTYSQYKHWNDTNSNANGISWVGSLIRPNCMKANEDYYTFDKTVTSTTEGTYYIWDNDNKVFLEKTLPADFVEKTKYYTKSTTAEDGVFITNLQEDVKNAMVQVIKKTWSGYGGNVTNSTTANNDFTIIETKDWFFIPSGGEVFGTTDRYNPTTYDKFGYEGDQYQAFVEYKMNRYMTPSAEWFRSPIQNSSNSFCYWYSNGSLSINSANTSYYLSLCFCI